MKRIRDIRKHARNVTSQDNYLKHTELMSAMLKYNLYMGHDLAWDQMAKDNNLVVEDLRGFLSGRSHDIGMYNQLITYVQGRYSLRSLDVQADYRFADHMPLMRKSNLDDHSSNITSLTGISINDYNPQYQYQLPELSDGISKQSVQHITTLNSSVKTITV